MSALARAADRVDTPCDMARARYLWVREHLEPGTRVLDFGCRHEDGVALLAAGGLVATAWPRGRGGVVPQLPTEARYDAILAFDVLAEMATPPMAAMMLLEKHADVAIVSVPYMEHRDPNSLSRWWRLQEATFPGRLIAYQDAESLTTLPLERPVSMIVCTQPRTT